MRITQVEFYLVEIPPIPPIARYHPKIYDIALTRVVADEGLIGWGECQGRKADLEPRIQQVVGEDPLSLDFFGQPDPLNCALADIAGQAWGVPVHHFFGAKVRDRVPVS